MVRLIVHVEGQTEETFVAEVLSHHLLPFGYYRVDARRVGNARTANKRQGICSWAAARKEIIEHLRADHNCIATTMVDYYGLPKANQRAWPGRDVAERALLSERADTVQRALHEDLCNRMDESFHKRRFIPYVSMHEFEALLFSDCDGFAQAVGRSSLASQLSAICDEFNHPEEINDSEASAPSRRIKTIFGTYEKPLAGAVAAITIGLEKMRDKCPNFGRWLDNLESTPATLRRRQR